jgi:hypothetical protein
MRVAPVPWDWSGEPSHRVALLLREWLQMLVQVAEPWVSSEDIARGTLWRTELAGELADGSTGILCVTRENVASPWVNFEAGALSKTPETARVIPFLFEMRPSDIRGPLADLMGAIFERGAPRTKESSASSSQDRLGLGR